MNIENFKLVLAKIESDPNCWDQRKWHCGTKHCFAGWAQILSGKKPDHHVVRKDARIFLGLGKDEADYLFDPERTLIDFKNAMEVDLDGYHLDGYNRFGYNRDGYDRDGYDRDGLDIDNKEPSK